MGTDLLRVRASLLASDDPHLHRLGEIVDRRLTANDPTPLEAALGTRHAFQSAVVDLRDIILRDGARHHFGNLRPVERARRMSKGLKDYQSDIWPRTRTKHECPHRLETLEAVFWSALKRKDHALSQKHMLHILRDLGQ